MSENFCTPIQKSKRLGLRRNNHNSVSKDCKEKTPLSSSTKKASATGPQSDVKVNYGNLEIHRIAGGETPVSSTPRTTPIGIHQRQCVSTNCRPYRLSLSKRIREKMTKKRLEFHVANELEKEEEDQKKLLEEERLDLQKSEHFPISSQETENSSGLTPAFSGINTDSEKLSCSHINPEQMSREQLLASIAEMRKELKSREGHKRKVQELQQAIETWKQGFACALRDLQAKITPHYEFETLLEHLHIPKDMIKYVND